MAPIYCLWVVGIWAPAMFLEIGVKELGGSSHQSSLLGVSAIPGLLTSGTVSDRLAGQGKGRKGFAALILLAMAVEMFPMVIAVATRTQHIVLALPVFVAGGWIWGGVGADLRSPVRHHAGVAPGNIVRPERHDQLHRFAGALVLFLVRPAFRWRREASAR